MQREQIKHLVAQMTLEEKAGLTAGENGWWTKACERLNIPAVHMTDGPHGLRNVIEENQNMLNGNTMEAVCFPAECAMASSLTAICCLRPGRSSAEKRRLRAWIFSLAPASI